MWCIPSPKPASEAQAANQADPTVLTLLSLKLLLLAFFILLTSLAEFQEDRTRQVLESVSEAFNGQVQADRSYNLSSSALANLDSLETLFGEVGDLFRSSLPAVKVESSADQPLVSFELRAATLFAPGTTDLRPGRWLLLRRLVDSLTLRGRSGLPYQLSVLHGVAAAGLSAGSGGAALELSRLGSLGHALTARGLPAGQFSIALEPGAPGVVRFVLQLDTAAVEEPAQAAAGDG